MSWERSATSVELHSRGRPIPISSLPKSVRLPFIKTESWPGLVTHWDCGCHLGHTLCQLKLFFISWMIDSSLIVLLFLFSSCEKAGARTWECMDSDVWIEKWENLTECV